MTAPSNGRLAVLDGLRTAAIALVLARHSMRPFWPDPSAPFMTIGPVEFGWFFLNGWTGVDLFFVLSGFLITEQLRKIDFSNAGQRAIQIRHFLLRRFFRIAPAYYLVLFVAALQMALVEPQENIAWRLFYHLLFMNDYFPSDICVAFWSLAIEFKFYVLAPFILWVFVALPRAGLVLAFASVFAMLTLLRFEQAQHAMQDTSYISWFLHTRNKFHLCLDGLMGGMAVNFVMHARSLQAVLGNRRIASCLSLGGLAAFIAVTGFAPLVDRGASLFDQTMLPSCLALILCILMLGLLAGGWGAGFLSRPCFRRSAMLSYAVYLVHMPLLPVAIRVSSLTFPSVSSPVLQWILILPGFLGLSFFMGWTLHVLIEKPAIDWSKRSFSL